MLVKSKSVISQPLSYSFLSLFQFLSGFVDPRDDMFCAENKLRQ